MADKAPPTSAQREAQARQDALALVADSHDLAHADVIHRITTWMRRDPARLVYCCWQLAVWHDPNQPISWLDAAVPTLTQPRTEAAA